MKRFAAALLLLLSFPPLANAEPAPPRLTGVETADAYCRIEWEKDKDASGYNVYLKNEEGYIPLNDAPLKDPFTGIRGLVNGMPYVFAVTALGKEGEESKASLTPMVIPVGYSHEELSLKGGSSAADYHIFSTPFVSRRDRPEEFFSYLPEYERSAWRLFSLEKDGYHEYKGIKSIAPGKAYWFLSAEDRDIFLSGKTVNNYEPFTVKLHGGWNLIGSPFLYPVEWEEVVRRNPALQSFLGAGIWEFEGGGFRRAEILRPFRGYYVFSAYEGEADLLIPPVPLKPSLAEKAAVPLSASLPGIGRAAKSGWLLRMAAGDGVYSDVDNILGMAAERFPDEGAGDVEPPAWPQHLSLYFLKGDGRAASEIKEGKGEWTAVVEGGESGKVTLSWERLSGDPRTELVDVAENRTVDMVAANSYTFTREDTSPRKFLIRSK